MVIAKMTHRKNGLPCLHFSSEHDWVLPYAFDNKAFSLNLTAMAVIPHQR
jgi:hypothetical protein